MNKAADVRSPKFDRFWREFRNRLLAAARKTCAGSKWQLASGPEDFAHGGFMVAMSFMGNRIGRREASLELLESFSDEAFSYARAAMKNDFLDEVRKAVQSHLYREARTPSPNESEESGSWRHARPHTPEDYAAVTRLAQQMSQGGTATHKKIAEAAAIVAREGGDRVSGKDVTALAGVSSRDLADFRRRAAKRGLRPDSNNDEV
jgi:hypothetical protein